MNHSNETDIDDVAGRLNHALALNRCIVNALHPDHAGATTCKQHSSSSIFDVWTDNWSQKPLHVLLNKYMDQHELSKFVRQTQSNINSTF